MTRVLPVEEYADELKRGPMPKWEIQRLYNVPLLPIAVPLEQGDLEENYECCFVEWLKNKGIDFAQFLLDSNTERTQRIAFAKFKAKMFTEGVRIAPTSAKRAREEPEKEEDDEEEGEIKDDPVKEEKQEKMEKKEEDVSGGEEQQNQAEAQEEVRIKVEEIYERVEKRPRREENPGEHWVEIKRELVENLTPTEQMHNQISNNEDTEDTLSRVGVREQRDESVQPSDLARHHQPGKQALRSECGDDNAVQDDARADEHTSHILSSAAVQVPEDPIERKLVADYDRVNDQVILYEQQLEDSVARLSTRATLVIGEILELQAENDELRRQIQALTKDRNAALGLLVVYLWRNEPDELESLMSGCGDADVARVQHTIHRKCTKLACDAAVLADTLARFTTELDAAITSEQYAKMTTVATVLSSGEASMVTLRKQRKRDLATLVRFDQHLRVEIQALLANTKQNQ